MPEFVSAALAGSLLCGVGAYLLAPWVLRRIPEPELDDGQTKVLYTAMANGRTALWSGVFGAVAGGAVGARLGWSAPLAAWLALAISAGMLCYIDLRTRFLPSAIIWPTYLIVAVLLLAATVVSGEWDSMRRAVIAAVAGFAVFYVMWWVYPSGIGFGDVRLSGLLSGALGWLGWGEVVIGLYGGFVLGAIVGVALTVTKVFERKAFPFGPFMIAGAVAGVLVGEPLMHAYLG